MVSLKEKRQIISNGNSDDNNDGNCAINIDSDTNAGYKSILTLTYDISTKRKEMLNHIHLFCYWKNLANDTLKCYTKVSICLPIV